MQVENRAEMERRSMPTEDVSPSQNYASDKYKIHLLTLVDAIKYREEIPPKRKLRLLCCVKVEIIPQREQGCASKIVLLIKHFLHDLHSIGVFLRTIALHISVHDILFLTFPSSLLLVTFFFPLSSLLGRCTPSAGVSCIAYHVDGFITTLMGEC